MNKRKNNVAPVEVFILPNFLMLYQTSIYVFPDNYEKTILSDKTFVD